MQAKMLALTGVEAGRTTGSVNELQGVRLA